MFVFLWHCPLLVTGNVALYSWRHRLHMIIFKLQTDAKPNKRTKIAVCSFNYWIRTFPQGLTVLVALRTCKWGWFKATWVLICISWCTKELISHVCIDQFFVPRARAQQSAALFETFRAQPHLPHICPEEELWLSHRFISFLFFKASFLLSQRAITRHSQIHYRRFQIVENRWIKMSFQIHRR